MQKGEHKGKKNDLNMFNFGSCQQKANACLFLSMMMAGPWML